MGEVRMKFKDWIKNSEVEIEDAMKEYEKSKIIRSNMNPSLLLPYYIQYMMWKSNRWLVWATWGLAIATCILVIATIILMFIK